MATDVDMQTRNNEIAKLYLEGKTLEECGEIYRISRQRIKQILKKYGVWRKRAESSDLRDELLGVTLSKADKLALREEAQRRGLSMSALTSDLIKEMLGRPKEETV